MNTDERIAANIAQDLELRTELHREGDSLELRYHVTNHGKEAVILMNFVSRTHSDGKANLNAAMAELQADGNLKISQQVLNEGRPPSSFRPIHAYTLLPPGKTRDHSIPLSPNQVFWDTNGFHLTPLPQAQKVVFCLGLVPVSSTNLELTEGETRVAGVGSKLFGQQTLMCSQPMAMK
jgi:hypothetical protein